LQSLHSVLVGALWRIAVETVSHDAARLLRPWYGRHRRWPWPRPILYPWTLPGAAARAAPDDSSRSRRQSGTLPARRWR